MLSFFMVLLTIFTFVCSDEDKKIKINGCTLEDILFFQSLINENIHILNINQNAGTVSQEMINFYETKFCLKQK